MAMKSKFYLNLIKKSILIRVIVYLINKLCAQLVLNLHLEVEIVKNSFKKVFFYDIINLGIGVHKNACNLKFKTIGGKNGNYKFKVIKFSQLRIPRN